MTTDAKDPGREQHQYAILPLPDGNWPGPAKTDVSVADELAFDALPESTRLLAERVARLRLFEGTNYHSYEEAYEDGMVAGEAAAEKGFKQDRADFGTRIEGLVREVDRLSAECERLANANAVLGNTNNTLQRELRAARRASA